MIVFFSGKNGFASAFTAATLLSSSHNQEVIMLHFPLNFHQDSSNIERVMTWKHMKNHAKTARVRAKIKIDTCPFKTFNLDILLTFYQIFKSVHAFLLLFLLLRKLGLSYCEIIVFSGKTGIYNAFHSTYTFHLFIQTRGLSNLRSILVSRL